LVLSYNFLNNLAILYAQQRPVTLPRQGITAAAGTFLARGSNKMKLHNTYSWTNFTALIAFTTYLVYHFTRNAGSNFRSLTNILHCCQRWDVFQLPCDWTVSQPS